MISFKNYFSETFFTLRGCVYTNINLYQFYQYLTAFNNFMNTASSQFENDQNHNDRYNATKNGCDADY